MNYTVGKISNEQGFSSNSHTGSLGQGGTVMEYSYNDLDHVKWDKPKSKAVPAISVYAGADKGRGSLLNTKVSASSDFIVSNEGKRRFLELMSDYTGYWARNGKMELRDSKFKRLQELNSLFLGVSAIDNKFILLDMGGEFESIFIPSYSFESIFIPSYSLYGGKSAYSVKLPEQSMKVLDFQVLASEIISKI